MGLSIRLLTSCCCCCCCCCCGCCCCCCSRFCRRCCCHILGPMRPYVFRGLFAARLAARGVFLIPFEFMSMLQRRFVCKICLDLCSGRLLCFLQAVLVLLRVFVLAIRRVVLVGFTKPVVMSCRGRGRRGMQFSCTK